MSKPRLLDLGCGAGGASTGYDMAGFEVTGVDVVPQPRYPFTFIQADALMVLSSLTSLGWYADLNGTAIVTEDFDAYHASMPCQRWAQATLGQRRRGREYPDLVTPLRPLLQATGKPWVMENVPEAPLRTDLQLCGCVFGLSIHGVGELRRTRTFELSWRDTPLPPLVHYHKAPAISICGHGTPAWQRRITGHVPVAMWREVMGIGWMNREELTEAIPPAYTALIGGLLMREMGL